MIEDLRFKTENFKGGFTLVEMLVYTAMFTVMISALTAFMSVLSQSRIRNQSVLEVNDQGTQVMRVITQNLRNAVYINSPATSTTGSTLSINTTLASTTPTTFTLTNGVIFLTQGANPSVALTNNKVIVSNLSFTNLSRASTYGNAKVFFTLVSNSASTKAKYNYSNVFYGGGSLR
jgi:Tfp pilus assembly protein PilW